jgi:hypothetical protein
LAAKDFPFSSSDMTLRCTHLYSSTIKSSIFIRSAGRSAGCVTHSLPLAAWHSFTRPRHRSVRPRRSVPLPRPSRHHGTSAGCSLGAARSLPRKRQQQRPRGGEDPAATRGGRIRYRRLNPAYTRRLGQAAARWPGLRPKPRAPLPTISASEHAHRPGQVAAG